MDMTSVELMDAMTEATLVALMAAKLVALTGS
jgi:hypothetical protein